jgi:NDP-4-keto-2,6-dideoxyhexose 3-C-methyltransferase
MKGAHVETQEKISRCRVCTGPVGVDVLNLGDQALTGMFARNGKDVPVRAMSLSMCDACGLVQLNEIYDLSLLYGEHYGYESSLNVSMVRHLKGKAEALQSKVALSPGDVVIDIGSNDATTLSFFPGDVRRIGVDATGTKFQAKYDAIGAELVPAFFPSSKLDALLGGAKAKAISSYSCFYDLPDPVGFAKSIAAVLAPDGVWCLEQSYMPEMLATNSFDTVCHEHLEYYRLTDIDNICRAAGLKIADVSFNPTNGGSFSVDVVHATDPRQASAQVEETLKMEAGKDWRAEYRAFLIRINARRDELVALLNKLKGEGKRVAGLGASTKGNVLLQYYSLTPALVDSIGEVNANKFGCETPGSAIPIVSEDALLADDPDYLLVLPWHFRDFFMRSPKFKGRKLIFPLPQVEIVTP